MVQSNRSRQDNEFDEWYNDTHLVSIFGTKGHVYARRFVVVPDASGSAADPRYLVICEMDRH